ncbi:pyruvate/2-oxoglutarate dehydrogenase complex dihydrolipoamide acyltransferase (E2) component [Cryobacterium sp. MP_M5]|uniref:dihydrolipoamide acetyltransferase family protein n=1 Tax=unclassified Cryobacterium TaxID=2649013 RepID=UPI001A27FBC2|nr:MULTISPECIES: dihydrolipoamide acetyltransferase family protein [unclassified Cryobacterium]MBG6057524.1 pyruvate dehydrogenase E2 component (dihydrolipoamide acetyltransferase) [Cryobacterium sp. MP_M3]MEC5175961.1 pyruvate/2-oxoglutarate dehydrogenase complex dihydrolipoamide acyltransferase (E2) component [Cryobacterium sp. MP_M5]
MMTNDFILPDLGEGLTEAEIVSWLVSVGDTIAIDQPVVEVESAKSIVELPSPFGGVVKALFGEAGQVIHSGQVLLSVTDSTQPSSGPVPPPASAPEPASASASAPEPAATPVGPSEEPSEEPSEASGAVLVGYGTSENTRPVRRPSAARFGARGGQPGAVPVPPATAAVAAPVPPAAAAASPAAGPPGLGRPSPVVSPIVRRLARENGFDASTLRGSGPNDLVLRRDVEARIRAAEAPAPARTAAPAPAQAAQPAVAPTTGDTRIPITGLRKVVAERLAQSRREIPEATIWLDVDATELFTARDRLLAATGERFSVTALIARFVVAGLRRYPLLNASVDTASQEILVRGDINLGIAAQTPRGLMVPVVQGAHALTTRQLRDAIAGLVTQAGDGAFSPGALAGGTFTLNNFGSLGVDGSAAIINHPEAAILGIGRMIERPWVVDHQLAVRTVVELSMVFDHRVCDGDTAAGFLTYVARCIESPVSLLADL